MHSVLNFNKLKEAFPTIKELLAMNLAVLFGDSPIKI